MSGKEVVAMACGLVGIVALVVEVWLAVTHWPEIWAWLNTPSPWPWHHTYIVWLLIGNGAWSVFRRWAPPETWERTP